MCCRFLVDTVSKDEPEKCVCSAFCTCHFPMLKLVVMKDASKIGRVGAIVIETKLRHKTT